MWDVIALNPDHCLSIYFIKGIAIKLKQDWKGILV